jgi:hypothetical protein
MITTCRCVWSLGFVTCLVLSHKMDVDGLNEIHISWNFVFVRTLLENRDSSVGIGTGCGLADQMIGVRFSAGAGDFSLHHRVQTGSGPHPASYPTGTRGSLPGSKTAPGHEADHSAPSSVEVKVCVELYLHSPNTSSWRGA